MGPTRLLGVDRDSQRTAPDRRCSRRPLRDVSWPWVCRGRRTHRARGLRCKHGGPDVHRASNSRPGFHGRPEHDGAGLGDSAPRHAVDARLHERSRQAQGQRWGHADGNDGPPAVRGPADLHGRHPVDRDGAGLRSDARVRRSVRCRIGESDPQDRFDAANHRRPTQRRHVSRGQRSSGRDSNGICAAGIPARRAADRGNYRLRRHRRRLLPTLAIERCDDPDNRRYRQRKGWISVGPYERRERDKPASCRLVRRPTERRSRLQRREHWARVVCAPLHNGRGCKANEGRDVPHRRCGMRGLSRVE